MSVFATTARLLHSAEWGGWITDDTAIHSLEASLQSFGDVHRFCIFARDGFLDRIYPHDRAHRSQELRFVDCEGVSDTG